MENTKVLLILTFLGTCYGAPTNSSCTSEEMLLPITDIKNLIGELKTEGVNHEKKLEEIETFLTVIKKLHDDAVNSTCGQEQAEAHETLNNFYSSFPRSMIIGADIISEDYNEAKHAFQNITCKHTLQYAITKTYSILGGLAEIIEVAKLMDDPKMINNMHEGIIYTLNNRNIKDGKLLVPILRDHIISSKSNNDDEIVKNAKLNLKLLTERTISYYPDAMNTLNEVDSEMADKAIQDIVKQVFTNTLYSKSFDIINSVSIIHLKSVALKALRDKVISMNLANSLIATKIFTVADSIRPTILDKEDYAGDLKILNRILDSITEFNKRLFTGQICRTFDDIEPLNDTNVKRDYDYFLFENPSDLPDIELEDLYVIKENGTLLRINVESNDMRYFYLLKNEKYPEHIDLSGTIRSKQELSYGNVDEAQYCNIRESIEYNICITVYEYLLLSQEDGASLMKKSLKRMKQHNDKLFSQC